MTQDCTWYQKITGYPKHLHTRFNRIHKYLAWSESWTIWRPDHPMTNWQALDRTDASCSLELPNDDILAVWQLAIHLPEHGEKDNTICWKRLWKSWKVRQTRSISHKKVKGAKVHRLICIWLWLFMYGRTAKALHWKIYVIQEWLKAT